MKLLVVLPVLCWSALVSDAFVVSRGVVPKRSSFVRFAEKDNDEEESDADKFLKSKFPEFYNLLIRPSKDVSKVVIDESAKCTIFAPSSAFFQTLDQKRLQQLQDPRNLETVEKMAAYHVIPEECISWNQLFQEDWTVPKVDGKPQLSIGGVKTLGGDVNIGRSLSGGLFGSPFGAKEDGGVTVGSNNAKIIQSFTIGKNGKQQCIVHELDNMVSPEILWRYCDQLRIPGF